MGKMKIGVEEERVGGVGNGCSGGGVGDGISVFFFLFWLACFSSF